MEKKIRPFKERKFFLFSVELLLFSISFFFQPSDTRMSSEETLTKHLKMLVNESIISLLLKLHAQLSGSPDSYVMGRQAAEGMLDSRIGDGPFFVAKVLDRIALLDERCR